MWWPFSNQKQENADEPVSILRQDFSECVVADFIPT